MPKGALGYAVLSFVSLLVALVAGWWIVTSADLLGVRFDRAYYVLLIILGLAVALMLFGAMRSVAKVTSNQFGVVVELGGPAALFALVVAGGVWFLQPAPVFAMKVRLDYAGPPVNREDFAAAMKDAELAMLAGNYTGPWQRPNDFGEVSFFEIPGRLRDGKFNVQIRGSSIDFKNPATNLSFPAADQPVVLEAVLVESSDRRNERTEALADLRGVIEEIRMTLANREVVLFPKIDYFLSNPTQANWDLVLEKAEEIQSQIDAGLKAAAEYKAKYGGLTGIDTILTEVDLIFRDPLAGVIAQWNGKENVLVNAPNGLPATDVAQQWYDSLKTSYEGLARELEALEKELAVPA